MTASVRDAGSRRNKSITNMPRKKSAAAGAPQETLEGLRAELAAAREQHEQQSSQALKLLETKDAELAAFKDGASTPVSPEKDDSAAQAATEEATRLRADAEAKAAEAAILQRARAEAADEVARLQADLDAAGAGAAAKQAACAACSAAVAEVSRLRAAATRAEGGRDADRAALATTARALDELTTRSAATEAALAQATQDLARSASTAKAKATEARSESRAATTDAIKVETARADTAVAELRAARAAAEKTQKRLGALKRSQCEHAQREEQAAATLDEARALRDAAQADVAAALAAQTAAKRDGAAELARALDARDLRRRLSLAEADRDATQKDAEDLRTALRAARDDVPPPPPVQEPPHPFVAPAGDNATVAELAASLTEAHQQLDTCRASLDALNGSDEDVKARCCALTARLHEEAGERSRLERLRARCRCAETEGRNDACDDVSRRALSAALAAQAAKKSLHAEHYASASKALAAARCRANVAERARDLADARSNDAAEALHEALALHGIDRSALADRLPPSEQDALGATARALDDANRRVAASNDRAVVLEARLVAVTAEKADVAEALDRETQAARDMADRAAAAELASVAAASASRSGAGLRASPRWRSYVDDVLGTCTFDKDAAAALLEARSGLARLEARLEVSERRADSLQYRVARRGLESEEETFHVKPPKDPEVASLRREAQQLADEARASREAQTRTEAELRGAQQALGGLRLEQAALEARCTAAEASEADATRSALDLRSRAARAEAQSVNQVRTPDDARALARAVLERMDKIQTMANADAEPSEAIGVLEARCADLEADLEKALRRCEDEVKAHKAAKMSAGREASSRADLEVEVAQLREDLRSLKASKNLALLSDAARLEARAEDAEKRARLSAEDAKATRAKLVDAEKEAGRLEGSHVLAEEARKRADAASSRAKAAEERCRLAVEKGAQKAALAEKRATEAEKATVLASARASEAAAREEAGRVQARKDLNDVRVDAKRQRKVFQEFRKDKDELQKKHDALHAQLLEAKSRQATSKSREVALQRALQAKPKPVVEDEVKKDDDAHRRRSEEAARRRVRDVRLQKALLANELRVLEASLKEEIELREKADFRKGEADHRARAARRKADDAKDAFERERTKFEECKVLLGRKTEEFTQAKTARLRTARRADALAASIRDVGTRLARGLDRARDRAAQLARESGPTANLVAASLLDLAPAEVDSLMASLEPVSQIPTQRQQTDAEKAFVSTITSALEAADAARIRDSIITVVDERCEHERNLGLALGARDTAPKQRYVGDDCSVEATDARGVLEALGLG